jgi:hypothetical protein
VARAYADIGATLTNFSFDRVQGGLYKTPSEDLANLFGAILPVEVLERRGGGGLAGPDVLFWAASSFTLGLGPR